jgi:hypothetical protein
VCRLVTVALQYANVWQEYILVLRVVLLNLIVLVGVFEVLGLVLAIDVLDVFAVDARGFLNELERALLDADHHNEANENEPEHLEHAHHVVLAELFVLNMPVLPLDDAGVAGFDEAGHAAEDRVKWLVNF